MLHPNDAGICIAVSIHLFWHSYASPVLLVKEMKSGTSGFTWDFNIGRQGGICICEGAKDNHCGSTGCLMKNRKVNWQGYISFCSN